MITYYDKKLTPKQAAKIIISDGLGESLTHWEIDTNAGHQINTLLTDREKKQVDDQMAKILERINRYLR